MRLEGSQSRGSGVLEGEVAQRRQLVAHGSKPRRVSRSSDGSVVWSGRQRVVREGGRGRSRGVGRVGTRSLCVTRARVVVVVVLIVGVRSRHVVSREGRQVASRVVEAVRVVGMVSGGRAVERRRGESLALDLVGGLGQDGDVHVVVALRLAVEGAAQVGGQDILSRVGMRRRDIGRREARGGRRSDRLGSRGRSHHSILRHV